MKRIYLLTTEHLEKGLWFREEDDFKVGMNYVAIEAACRPEVSVLAFILMSNHVHFVLKGRLEEVTAFVNQFKQRFAVYYKRKYRVKEHFRRNGLDVKLIPYDDEAPERAVAYVVMNSVAANICTFCNQYPWGSGGVYFNPSLARGTCIGDLSARARKYLLHSSNKVLPEDWRMGNDGYILPENYVDINEVEALFRSPKRLNYFLNSSSKARRRLEMAEDHLPAFRDQTIGAALPDLCRSLFQKERYEQLAPEEQSEFLRQIRFRFSADVGQIARVCGLTYTETARQLNAV